MKKRLLLVATAIACLLACVLSLAACASKDEPSAHTHSYQWADNGDGTHSGHCSVTGCDKPNVKNETHNFGANGKCEKCSAVMLNDGHTHTWSQSYETNATHHWHVCMVSGCSEKNGYAEHNFAVGDCVCGKKKPTQGGEHEHTYSRDWTSAGAAGHYHVATCEHTCEHTAVVPHAYDNADDTTCNDCGYVRTVEPSHTHSLTHTSAKSATCTQDGNIAYWYCSDCDKHFLDKDGNTEIAFADTVIDKLGHDLQHIAAQSATCANVGWNAYDRCKRVNCGYSTETVIPATGKHTGGTATCTAKAVCTVCRNEYGEIDADNHDIQHHDAQAATCTTDGWNAYDACMRCDYTTKEILKANGHTLDENTVCTVCGVTAGTPGLTYTLNSGSDSYSVTGIGTAKGNIIIAPEYNSKPVTSIGENAFYGRSGLTSITIPDSITSIEKYAFSVCSGLTSVTIPDSVTSIGHGAFAGCSGLTSVTILDGVTSIGENAFYRCSGLTSITIPDSITSIEKYAFSVCSGLTSVTIPDSVTSIGHGAFAGCSGLTSVTIGNSVTSIVDGAFSDCSGLTSVTIPNSVTSIGDDAFFRCSGLTSVTIPDSVTSIESHAFFRCSGLTSITIPNSVTSIGSSAFSGCSSLTSITIGNSVTSIGGSAFGDCSNLEIVYWNATACESVGSTPGVHMDTAFEDCTKLTTVVIGDNVSTIPDYVFYCCSGLTSVTIPDSVTSIGWSAFASCSGLTSITIPDSVTSIGWSAFANCSGLTSITIGNGVTSIGDSTFRDCSSLTSVTFNGTKAQWKAVSKDINWNYNTGNYTVTCTDGKLDKNGNEIT